MPALWYFNMEPEELLRPSPESPTIGAYSSGVPGEYLPGEYLSDAHEIPEESLVPFVAPNTMILQFETDVSEEEILEYLEDHKLTVARKFSNIGAIQVETDLTPYLQMVINDGDMNEVLLRALLMAIEDFKDDPRIRSASPDLLLRNQDHHETSQHMRVNNLLRPNNVHTQSPDGPMEITDWGVNDVEATDLWDLPGAKDGVIFGAVDVGFARHEDIVFVDFPSDTNVDNHGNHVVGIACAQHNGRGIRGVLPNCFVRAQSAEVFFESIEGGSGIHGQMLRFNVLFSQILTTLYGFIDARDDVHTINVSLGYNWRSNFGINPDLPDAEISRALVEAQGVILVSLLESLSKRGRVIFSAAGNDSHGLGTPISARYASPFNWAALHARETGLSENGVIVEAHDRTGSRASFSNVGGHISCPGVDIQSTLALGANGVHSPLIYGTMSGTSMASPHCAAGYLLFTLVRPGYSGVGALSCLENSSCFV